MSYDVRLTSLAESELVSSALWWAEHRAVYGICKDTVEILTIRHLAQKELQPGDF